MTNENSTLSSRIKEKLLEAYNNWDSNILDILKDIYNTEKQIFDNCYNENNKINNNNNKEWDFLNGVEKLIRNFMKENLNGQNFLHVLVINLLI